MLEASAGKSDAGNCASNGTVHMRVVLIPEETPAGDEANTLTADSPLALARSGIDRGTR
jgi:hypothetical protein